ncbi:MAG: hypothetical protein NZ954_04875 [Thermofilaceae archaeon]|nr:hypothetical protein [Thermofilaceae archaeon]MCX8180139.1 hypothetical protein [Thermofilaceae archaeon]MDW8004205.1 hypothetical protein [Thermofilaceae archaeon]
MSGIRFGRILERDVQESFYCWVREAIGEGAERFRLEDPSKFWRFSWDEKIYTEFTEATYKRPPGLVTLSLRSREVFQNGVFQLHAKLPDWGPQGPMLWFGFEAEDLFGGGVAHFMLQGGQLRAFAGAWPHPTSLRLAGLPEDYSSKRHTYTVRVHDRLCLWFIDNRLSAAMALTDSEKNFVLYEGMPYSLGVTVLKPSAMAILIDIDGGTTEREWVWNDLHPWGLRVLEGSAKPYLALKLYRYGRDETLEGKVEGVTVSHPVPAAGSRVTFSVVSTVNLARVEACTLDGRWVVLDELELKAGKLLRWSEVVSEPFVRLTLEPVGQGEVSLAEAYIC